jgi:hypothetical protein
MGDAEVNGADLAAGPNQLSQGLRILTPHRLPGGKREFDAAKRLEAAPDRLGEIVRCRRIFRQRGAQNVADLFLHGALAVRRVYTQAGLGLLVKIAS